MWCLCTLMLSLLWDVKLQLYQSGHLLRHVQELVQVHTSVGELSEGTLFLDLGIRLEETKKYLNIHSHQSTPVPSRLMLIVEMKFLVSIPLIQS